MHTCFCSNPKSTSLLRFGKGGENPRAIQCSSFTSTLRNPSQLLVLCFAAARGDLVFLVSPSAPSPRGIQEKEEVSPSSQESIFTTGDSSILDDGFICIFGFNSTASSNRAAR